jgi:hypothetical protein
MRHEPPEPSPFGRIGPLERFIAWILTGPVGRFVAFFADLGVYWWRWARGRTTGDGQR